MLAALSPTDLVQARAAYRVLPLDDGWRQAGTIAATFHNEMERYMAGRAGKKSVDEKNWRSPEDYIPRIRAAKKTSKVNQASIDAVESIARGMG